MANKIKYTVITEDGVSFVFSGEKPKVGNHAQIYINNVCVLDSPIAEVLNGNQSV